MGEKSQSYSRVKVSARQWFADVGAWLRSFPPKARLADVTYNGLAAKYDAKVHGLYVEAIEGALCRPEKFKNIALSGGYGVGKSSVLSEIARAHSSEVIEISLSTLGLGDDGGGEKSSTNRIQKEIVKQLLYRQQPSRLTGSRFRRIGRFSPVRSIIPAIFIGSLTALVFKVTGWSEAVGGWTGQIQKSTGIGLPRDIWICGVAALAGYVLLFLLHNRIQVKGLTVAKTEFALSNADTTYFDQFLDEIVYYFEVDRRCTIVIFEDIDRFGDPHIFETLRALNTLLNGAKQLGGRKIRFIYAIRDSIFNEKGRPSISTPGLRFETENNQHNSIEQKETVTNGSNLDTFTASTNRTKFFDLVIPVVPFLTKENSAQVISSTMRECGINGISERLIQLVSVDLTDMRLIWNICTEFRFFEMRVMPPVEIDGIDLERDKLFAMVVYKNTHMGDFENIRLGESELNWLYDAATAVTNFGLFDRATKASIINQRLQSLDAADELAHELGERLEAYVLRLARHLNRLENSVGPICINSIEQSSDQIHRADFWRSYASEVEFLELTIQGTPLKISREDASNALGVLIDEVAWDRTKRDELESSLQNLQSERSFLGKANFAELAAHPEFVDSNSDNFSVLLERLSSPLAKRLVRAGFIDRYFALYTAPFYGENLSSRAMNFLMQNIDRHLTAPNYILSESEVDAIIAKRGPEILSSRSMLNTSVFDRVLSHDGKNAESIVQTLLMALPDEQNSILDSYLIDGKRRDELLRKLSPLWKRTLVFLTSKDRPLDTESCLSFVSAALKNLSEDTEQYEIDESLRAWLRSHLIDLEVFTDVEIKKEVVEKALRILMLSNVSATDLSPLRKDVREALVDMGMYDLTLENLRVAIGKDSDLSLSEIYKVAPAVYNRVLFDLSTYVNMISDQDGSVTIHDSQFLEQIISDVAAKDLSAVGRILDLGDTSIEVSDLASVPREIWPELAHRKRFSSTYANIKLYLNGSDEVDIALGEFLSAGVPILTSDEVLTTERIRLATIILGAEDTLSDAETRARLAKSVLGEANLTAVSVPTGNAELFGFLVKHNVIEDNIASFQVALARDWSTREAFLEHSDSFVNYASTALVPSSDISHLLSSERVPSAVKDFILKNADDFVTSVDQDILTQVLDYSISSNIPCSHTFLIQASNAGVEVSKILASLAVAGAEMERDNFIQVVKSFGGKYSDLLIKTRLRKTVPDTPADRALLDRLRVLGVVSKYTAEGDRLLVWMKRPAV